MDVKVSISGITETCTRFFKHNIYLYSLKVSDSTAGNNTCMLELRKLFVSCECLFVCILLVIDVQLVVKLA